jgi:diguanylate cyclase (GGDEF)-like protein/PAS domain S-box-containing protein
VGCPLFDFLDDEGADSARTAGERRRNGIAELGEARLHRDDGTVLHVLVEASPLVDQDGNYAGSVGMVTDITARKQVEREVSMLAALVQSSSDAVVACSLDGTVHSWNPAAETLFGYARGEIVGRPLSTIIQAGDEGVVRLVDAAAKGKLVGPFEIEAVAKDRTRIPVELTAFPVDDGLGQVTMVAATLRDVRERREAERLIREVERARTDVEKVGRLGTFEWHLDTGDVIWTEEMWRLHGREPGGRPADGYMEAVHPADRDDLHAAAVQAAETYQPLDIRYRIVLRSGDVRWLHSHAERAPDDGDGRRRMAGTVRDVTEIMRAEQNAQEARAELHRQALHDPLTSLPNRRLLIDRLSVALAQAERNHCGVAVIVADIDRFSLVNQELGHEFADQLLKAVAQRLVGLMRSGDTVGRLSGDEFAIACESIEPHKQAVDALAARVVDSFGEPFAVGGHEVYLVSSAGAAWASEAEPAERLLGRATAALQGAKERERGSFVVALPGGSAPYAGRGRLALRHAMRDALGEGQLRVVYQPIVDLGSEKPRALEALLRWDHPGLGPVSPLEFIPVAEDTGLILPIGEWVLNEACRTLAEIDEDMSVGVNLSPRQLMQQDLPAIVGAALTAAGVAPCRLILELTESILVVESERVARTLADLKEIGVRLALDDFGTGYSALGYLKRFPFDIVKVDRSFVRGLGQDSGDSAIVGAVLGMARALGMEVVAEGIETEEQLACLHELGAEYGQGFYFARPGAAPGGNRTGAANADM